MQALFILFLAALATALPSHLPSHIRTQFNNAINPRRASAVPSSFSWSSSDILISPKDDRPDIVSVKDPSIIFYEGTYHVFFSTSTGSYSMAYTNFSSFDEASSAPFYYLLDTAIGKGYTAAPQVFYFTPTSTWYLVYQNGNAAYSTNKDISDPAGWSAATNFYDDVPSTITENIGNGVWVDMWVICDHRICYLFSSDDNGHLYRSQTSLEDFPSGMDEPVIALEDDCATCLFEASNVYNVGGGTYLLIVEAIGSNGNRYFRSWTSDDLAGTWTPLADTEENPFAGISNVEFEGTAWTQSISHGEAVRTKVNQRMRLDPCDIRYLYQGVDPNADSSDYNLLPWRLGLLTQTSRC